MSGFGEKRNVYRVAVGRLEGGDHLEGLGVDGRMLAALKHIINGS